MARLPDSFDLWIRRARACADPARQLDYVLGALSGLREWHFLNIGTAAQPQPATAEIETRPYLLLFSDLARIEELVEQAENFRRGDPLPAITIPTAQAMPWCLKQPVGGLLVNPGEDAVAIPLGHLQDFHEEWTHRGGRKASGFWIPHLTTEEEDFWQDHGL